MTTNENKLPIGHGDIIIESVGPEVRWWVAVEENGKQRVRMIGRSYAFMGQRVLQAQDGTLRKVDASKLTPARIYSRKDREAGAKLALRAACDLAQTDVGDRVHLFYAGNGPSGLRWCFSADGYYSFEFEFDAPGVGDDCPSCGIELAEKSCDNCDWNKEAE